MHDGSTPLVTKYPTITVVTPSFNQAQFLEHTLRSVLDQGYPALEYIVLDGGSTDESPDIIERYSDRLAYWRSAPDEGQAAALRDGFAMASGDILAWLNSDDLLAPGSLEAVARTWNLHGGGTMVVGACQAFSERGCGRLHRASFQDEMYLRQQMPVDQILDLASHWFVGEFFYQPEVFFPRRAYEAVGGLDPTLYYAMDYDLWVRLALERTEVIVIEEVLALFREHAGQKTHNRAAMRRETIQVANRHLDAAPLSAERIRRRKRWNDRCQSLAVCRAFQLGHRIRHGHPR